MTCLDFVYVKLSKRQIILLHCTFPYFFLKKESGLTKICTYVYISKGKAVPLQAWIGPEGSRKLRFPDFVTKAQDVDKVVSLTHRLSLPPENAPGTHFC